MKKIPEPFRINMLRGREKISSIGYYDTVISCQERIKYEETELLRESRKTKQIRKIDEFITKSSINPQLNSVTGLSLGEDSKIQMVHICLNCEEQHEE